MASGVMAALRGGAVGSEAQRMMLGLRACAYAADDRGKRWLQRALAKLRDEAPVARRALGLAAGVVVVQG